MRLGREGGALGRLENIAPKRPVRRRHRRTWKVPIQRGTMEQSVQASETANLAMSIPAMCLIKLHHYWASTLSSIYITTTATQLPVQLGSTFGTAPQHIANGPVQLYESSGTGEPVPHCRSTVFLEIDSVYYLVGIRRTCRQSRGLSEQRRDSNTRH